MKVCFVTANWPPEASGGTEQVVVALARELRALGVDVFAISGSDRFRTHGEDVEHETHDGVPVHRVRRYFCEDDANGLVHERLVRIVRHLLLKHRPEVVHVHAFSRLGAGITPICREFGMRVVVTFHDLWVTCARYFRVPADGIRCPTGIDRGPCVPCIAELLPGADQAFIAAALQRRDHVLRAEVALAHVATAPSATAARFVRECLPFAAPIEVIPHGLLRPVPVEHLAERWHPGKPLRVGMFGGLVAVKGVRELVAAVAGLPCELHLSGPFHDAGLEHEVRARVAANGNRLVLRPHYTGAERHPARDLHLAVFPSKCQETYGLVVDEALAHGVPAVLSDQGAFAERAGVGGVVVTPIAQLASVLRELVGSPEKIAALRAAIPASLPTIVASAERHLELYRRLR
ncbi:MAG TPA: glycosyltransferase [Planctomycetota bacterium]|nr:glycosyltransferase [Planctomycetota bacterium]